MANQHPAESKKNRDKAIAEGKKRYLSATPCKKCGTYEKYVSTYGCCKCVVESGLKKLADKELMAPYRTKEKQSNKTYRYRQKKFSGVENLTKEENERILSIYKECGKITMETGVLHHVDHIVPISKGGKHHPDNLQILTAFDNIAKSNKLCA